MTKKMQAFTAAVNQLILGFIALDKLLHWVNHIVVTLQHLGC